MAIWIACWVQAGTAPTTAPRAPFSVDTSPERQTRLERVLDANPTNREALFELAEVFHQRGADADEAAVKEAEKLLRRLLTLETNHAAAHALLGSALTLKARDAVLPLTKLRLAQEGFRQLDVAVRLDPQEPRARLIRGFNSLAVPKMFDRLKFAAEDLGWLYALPADDPRAGSGRDRQWVAWNYGLALRRLKNTDKAREVWQAALAIDPESPRAAEIRDGLNQLRKP